MLKLSSSQNPLLHIHMYFQNNLFSKHKTNLSFFVKTGKRKKKKEVEPYKPTIMEKLNIIKNKSIHKITVVTRKKSMIYC